MHNQHIHEVVSFSVLPIETHNGANNEPFHTRTLRVTDKAGMTFQITLFADKSSEQLAMQVRA